MAPNPKSQNYLFGKFLPNFSSRNQGMRPAESHPEKRKENNQDPADIPGCTFSFPRKRRKVTEWHQPPPSQTSGSRAWTSLSLCSDSRDEWNPPEQGKGALFAFLVFLVFLVIPAQSWELAEQWPRFPSPAPKYASNPTFSPDFPWIFQESETFPCSSHEIPFSRGWDDPNGSRDHSG